MAAATDLPNHERLSRHENPRRYPAASPCWPAAPPRPPDRNIDTTYTAKSARASRARSSCCTTRSATCANSIKILTQQVVSAHYLVTDDPVPVIYSLVDEKNAGLARGHSSWKNFTLAEQQLDRHRDRQPGLDGHAGRPRLRAVPADADRRPDPAGARHRHAPPHRAGKHARPRRHRAAAQAGPGSDVPVEAARRRRPGHVAGRHRVAALAPIFQAQLPDIAWFQKKLAPWGYATPQSGELDEPTRTVLIRVPDEIPPRQHRRQAGCGDGGPAGSADQPDGPLPQPLPPVMTRRAAARRRRHPECRSAGSDPPVPAPHDAVRPAPPPPVSQCSTRHSADYR